PLVLDLSSESSAASCCIVGSRSRSTPSSRVWIIDRPCSAARRSSVPWIRNASCVRPSTVPSSPRVSRVMPTVYLTWHVGQTTLVGVTNKQEQTMAKMHAAVVTAFGEPPRYQEFDVPAPGDGVALVDVLAVGLHPRTRSGAAGAHYTSTGTLPMIPGIDG